MTTLSKIRNLHLDGVRYNDPWLIQILHDLGVQVDAEIDKMAIRRLIMGEKLTPIAAPAPRMVISNIEIPINSDSSTSIEGFSSSINAELAMEIEAKGISQNDVNSVMIDVCERNHHPVYFVEYQRLETPEELSVRTRHQNVFNRLLSLIDDIYVKVEEKLRQS